MKHRIVILTAWAAASALGFADKLPNTLDKPFLGCWLGFTESRDFEFAIGGDGTSELFFRKGRDRHTTSGCTLNIYYVVEEKNKGQWKSRFMKEDGFEEYDAETASPPLDKPVLFTATYTGDTKVEIGHRFHKDRVEISTRLVEKKTKNEVRVGVRILVGDMFRHIKEKELKGRELRSKLRDTELVVWPVGGKKSSGERLKFEKYEVKLPERYPKGARKISIESDRLADHEYTLSTANEEFGVFEFRQKKALLHGFYVHWWPDPAKRDEKDCRLVIAVK